MASPAIIFGVMGRRQARAGLTTKGGMATAGLWLGIASLALVALGFLLVIAVFALSA